MKKVKKFFEENHLNKGYKKSEERQVTSLEDFPSKEILKELQNVIPSLNIEVIERYEEIYPGALQRILDIASTEQKHRHLMQVKTIEKKSQKLKFTKFLSASLVLTVFIVSLTTISLVFLGYELISVIFCVASFISIIPLLIYIRNYYSSNTDFQSDVSDPSPSKLSKDTPISSSGHKSNSKPVITPYSETSGKDLDKDNTSNTEVVEKNRYNRYKRRMRRNK